MSWEVKFNFAGFHTETLWKEEHALMDPGYPFIGMPFDYFKDFEKDLAVKYPNHSINCAKEDWCQFDVPCDEIRDDMPDLVFSFPVAHHLLDTVSYSVPSKSFLFDNEDLRTKAKTCHLGIVAQKFSEFDHFLLGQVFMENFYVTYDGTNPD